jgi:peptidyl-tRNA hydrolase
MIPWWNTWRNVTWLYFFLSTKNTCKSRTLWVKSGSGKANHSVKKLDELGEIKEPAHVHHLKENNAMSGFCVAN